MILRRLGNKKKIAKEIQKYFPPHKIYIEPFFGAGGMFFNKPKAKYNIVNDLDSNVFNLFQLITENKEQLENELRITPIHSDLFDYWKNNKQKESIKKAVCFLFMSNLLIPTTGDINRKGYDKGKDLMLSNLDLTINFLEKTNIRFFNEDCIQFIDSIGLRGLERPKEDANMFIYCDPPYLGTSNNYENGFTEEQSNNLFDSLIKKNIKFAMSEFDNEFILDQAKERGLNVIIIGERQNLKNRRTEILVTNYSNNQQSLF